MPEPVTTLEYLAQQIGDQQWLHLRSGRPVFARIARDLLSRACYGLKYVDYKGRPTLQVKSLPLPPPQTQAACDEFDVDRSSFDQALAQARTMLRFGLQTGAIQRLDAGRLEIISPNRPTAFLVREKPAHGGRSVGIVVAESLRELHTTVAGFGEADHYEYTPLPTGQGVMFPIKKAATKGLGEAGIEAMVPRTGRLELPACLRQMLEKTSVWFDLAVTKPVAA